MIVGIDMSLTITLNMILSAIESSAMCTSCKSRYKLLTVMIVMSVKLSMMWQLGLASMMMAVMLELMLEKFEDKKRKPDLNHNQIGRSITIVLSLQV